MVLALVGGRLDAAVLARCAALDPELTIHVGTDGPGTWLAADELLAPGPVLRERLDAIHRRWSTPDRRVDATFAIHGYAWYLGVAGVAPFLVGGVAPDLAPARVALRLDDQGGLDGVGLRTLASAGDDAAALRGQLEAHLSVVVERLRDESPVGRRALWAVAADAIAAACLFVGQRLNAERAAVELVDALLRHPGSALRWAGSFVVIQGPTVSETMQRRGSCCLSYRIDDGVTCDSCPLQPEDERLARLQASLLARVLD